MSEVASLLGKKEAIDDVRLVSPGTQSLAAPALAPTPTTASPDALSSSPSCSSSGTSKKRKQMALIDNAMAVALKKLSSSPSHVDHDPCLYISKLVYSELKNMNEHQQKLAKKLIFDVVHLGDMGYLTGNHAINVLQVADSSHFMA